MGAMLSVLTWAFFFLILYFEVLLLIGFIERLIFKKSAENEAGALPSVEVVVPCFNEEKTVAATVKSILALTYPSELLRVHVVNDGSTDGTLEALSEFKENRQVTISSKENGGKHTALNHAIEKSNADILGCLDADSFVHKNALMEMVKVFSNTKALAVTPAIKVETTDSLFRKMQKAEYEVGILFRRIFADANAQFITPGPFSLYRKEVFENIGLFRAAHNTEDLEMGLRIQDAGGIIENAPKAQVYTRAPKTFKPLFKQRVRWAYGFLRNAGPYKHMFFNPKNIYLGFFVLPLTFLSIFAAAYLPFALLGNTAHAAFMKFGEMQAVGLSAFYFNPTQIDWFSLVPMSLSYVVVMLIVLTGILVLAGKYVGGEKVRPDGGMLLYILMYGLFGPIWLIRAIFDAYFIKKNSWR